MKIDLLPQPYVIYINDSIEGSLRLEKDYIFKIDGLTFVIDKGFIYDGTSVPSFAWSLFKFERRGVHDPAGIVHDYLYRNGFLKTMAGSEAFFTRKQADLLFKDMLDYLGIKSWLSKLAYVGVRWFGKSSWKGKS